MSLTVIQLAQHSILSWFAHAIHYMQALKECKKWNLSEDDDATVMETVEMLDTVSMELDGF